MDAKERRREYARQYNKKYHEAHKEQISQRKKQYREEHKEKRAAYEKEYNKTHRAERNTHKKQAYHIKAISFDEADKESPLYKDYITKREAFELDDSAENQQALKTAELRLTRSISQARGKAYELEIEKKLKAELADTEIKVYSQVSYNKKIIDLVLTQQNADKTELDLSQAVIISIKSSGSAYTWKKDQPYLNLGKAYILLSQSSYYPSAESFHSLTGTTPRFIITEHIKESEPEREDVKPIDKLSDLIKSFLL